MSVTLPIHMQAITIADGALHATTLPLPATAEGELLLRVAYIGTNRADVMQVAGNYAPPEGASPLPGLEVSGHVVSSGHGFTAGEPVCALLSGGGYAEYVAVPTAQVLRLPTGIDLKHAACLPEAAATSIMALADEGRLQAGERVLIHGGTSGLGLLMTQIARSWGAEVYATVGSPEKAAFLESLGIRPINHRAAPFADALMAMTDNSGVDVIIDTLGGPMVETHFRLLKRGGRLVTLAMMDGSALPPMKATRLLMNHLHWSGATLRSRTAAEKAAILQQVAARIWPEVATGAIQPHVDSIFPLAEAEKALNRMQERLHMGKILLEVTPGNT